MIGSLNYFRNYPALLLAFTLISLSALACSTPVSDPVAGEKIYQRCMACHSFTENRTGPKHCGLFGRKAGSVSGFNYSDAMRNSGITWNDESLDAFLKSPLKNIPGTIMGYAGVKDNQERLDLIAYLKKASQANDCK